MTIASTLRSRWLVGILLAIVVTRIPFLLTCYSSDADAWLVAHVGKIFWQTGQYEVSRFPGYPLHEILTGPFVLLGGSRLSNAATLATSLILVIVWYRFVERHTLSPRLLTVLLAFTPLVWIDSAATLDYVWSLLFFLLSFEAVDNKRHVIAGLWLGCAIGCRPTNMVVVLPLLTFLYLGSASRRAFAAFIVATLCSSLVSLSPVLLTYGLTGWVEQTLHDTSDSHLPLMQRVLFFLYRSTYSIGPLAVLGIATVLTIGRRRLTQLCREREPIFVASITGVLAFAALFVLFPLDRSYLLPAIPFLFLIVERIASIRALVAIACCVVSFAFVNPDVIKHAVPIGRPGLNVHPGIVVDEWHNRNQLIKDRETITALPIVGKAVVMVGIGELYLLENENVAPDTAQRWTEFKDYVARSRNNHDLHFISGLPLHAVHRLRSEGYQLFCLSRTREKLRQWYGYVPEEEGIRVLEL